jgi:hypothetical protein
MSALCNQILQGAYGAQIHGALQRIEIPLYVPQMLEDQTGHVEPEYD